MASRFSAALLRSFGRPTFRQPTSLRIPVARAAYSTEAPPPPLLTKLKEDLKTAMRAKDTNRLSVLRAVLAATLNASKTDKPIKTDAQLVSLLRKSAGKAAEAAAEARAAGREDLAEKEEAQQKILEEYASSAGGREVGAEELRQLAASRKAALLAEGVAENALAGQMMKRFFMPGGELDGATIDKKEAAKIIMEVCKGQ
ncbi:hypothetical protein VTI74DRAFT_10860 [Chaetomium olivicolor]